MIMQLINTIIYTATYPDILKISMMTPEYKQRKSVRSRLSLCTYIVVLVYPELNTYYYFLSFCVRAITKE